MRFALLLMFALPALCAAQTRSVQQLVRSDSMPNIAIEVDASLSYLGSFRSLVMNNTAEAERYIFGDIRNGQLRRVAIVHFERFLPAAKGAFRYPRFRMRMVAGVEYLEQIWPLAEDLPASEFFAPAQFQAILNRWGVKPEPKWMMHRYVRAVDPAMQHELILFYLESESEAGVKVSELAKDWEPRGIAGASGKAFEDAFRVRADAALRVIDAKQ